MFIHATRQVPLAMRHRPHLHRHLTFTRTKTVSSHHHVNEKLRRHAHKTLHRGTNSSESQPKNHQRPISSAKHFKLKMEGWGFYFPRKGEPGYDKWVEKVAEGLRKIEELRRQTLNDHPPE